jgi:hypothetical protein
MRILSLSASCCVVLNALGCAPPPAPSVPARHADAPNALLPADLDVVVRIDVEQLEAQLGKDVAEHAILDTLAGGEAAAERALLSRSLAHSDLLWFGWRSGAHGEGTDDILISRGQFSTLLEDEHSADPVWSRRSGSGKLAHLQRENAERGALVSLYPLGERWLAWASAHAAPELELRLVEGAAPDHLQPPERGTLSAAASPERLRARYQRDYPELTARFAGAEQLSAYFDSNERGLHAELELSFAVPERALDASQVAVQVFEQLGHNPCVVGVVARAARVSVFEKSLRVQAELDRAQVDGLWACILGQACCA